MWKSEIIPWKNEILIHDSILKVRENEVPQMHTNWPNEPAYVTASMRTQFIHWLTICIKFACLFCKSQKWVAVATATCYLARCWEMSLGVPFKKQIQHALYYSPHPKETNPLTGGLFFLSFKNWTAFVFFIYIICNTCLLERGKEKKNLLSKCYLPVWLEHDRDAAYRIPTFINTALRAILIPTIHLLNPRTPLPIRVYGSILNVPAKWVYFPRSETRVRYR